METVRLNPTFEFIAFSLRNVLASSEVYSAGAPITISRKSSGKPTSVCGLMSFGGRLSVALSTADVLLEAMMM